MVSGFFAGGLADSLQQQQQNKIQQQYLGLQQQVFQNEQQRQQRADLEKQRAEWWNFVDTFTAQGILAGHSAQEIMQPLTGILQQIRQNYTAAHEDPGIVDMRMAAAVSQAVKQQQSAGQQPSTPQAPQAAGPSPEPSAGTPAAPRSKNLTDTMPEGGVIGTTVEDIPRNAPLPVGRQAAQSTQADSVQKLTAALAVAPKENVGLREALNARLKVAVDAESGGNVQFKTLKDEDGNEHPVFVDTKNKTITDPNGNPYVMPTSGGGNAAKIAESIESGKQPPTLAYLRKYAGNVRAKLAEDGFDLTQASLEYQAAQKQITSLNGPQMIRFQGLAQSVINTMDEARNLANEMQLGGVPAMNSLELDAYIQTRGNTPNGRLATRYREVIGVLKEEFANLANGGYAPTEPAWKLADQQINGNYGVYQLSDALGEAQRLIRYRINAIPGLTTRGPGSPNRYVPQQDQGKDQTGPKPGDKILGIFNPQTGEYK